MTIPSSPLNDNIYNRLRDTLLKCGPFSNYAELQALFVDPRINPWQNILPQSDNPLGQVTQTMALLLDKYNSENENALVLFLQVLVGYIDPRDQCHHQLQALAGELAQLLPETDLSKMVLTSSSPHSIRGENVTIIHGDVKNKIDKIEANVVNIS